MVRLEIQYKNIIDARVTKHPDWLLPLIIESAEKSFKVNKSIKRIVLVKDGKLILDLIKNKNNGIF